MSTKDTPTQIGDLPPLSRPANRALMAAGITTMVQVSEADSARLAAMHGVGPKAIRILGEALHAQGIPFAP